MRNGLADQFENSSPSSRNLRVDGQASQRGPALRAKMGLLKGFSRTDPVRIPEGSSNYDCPCSEAKGIRQRPERLQFLAGRRWLERSLRGAVAHCSREQF
jgi:hypothetical protein